MKQTAKGLAAIVGIVAAGLLFWEIIAAIMWVCYYAGFSM